MISKDKTVEYEGEENLNIMKLAKNYNNHLVNIILEAKKGKTQKIIDFGSGDGYFMHRLKENDEIDVKGIEPAENMQKYYTEKPYKSLSEIKENTIDFIYSLNVLEHIENDEEIVKEFYRVLTDNGEILLYLPAFPCLYSSMDKLVGHYRRYTQKDVSRLFKNNDWTVQDVRYADFIGWFVSLLFKYSGNKTGKPSTTALKIYDKFIFPLSVFLDKITFGTLLGKNIIIKASKKSS